MVLVDPALQPERGRVGCGAVNVSPVDSCRRRTEEPERPCPGRLGQVQLRRGGGRCRGGARGGVARRATTQCGKPQDSYARSVLAGKSQVPVHPVKGIPPPEDPPCPDDSEQEHVAAGQEQSTVYVVPSLHVSDEFASHEPPPPDTPVVPSEHVTPGPTEPESSVVTPESDDEDPSGEDPTSWPPSPADPSGEPLSLPLSPAVTSFRGSPVREPQPTRTISAAAVEIASLLALHDLNNTRWRT